MVRVCGGKERVASVLIGKAPFPEHSECSSLGNAVSVKSDREGIASVLGVLEGCKSCQCCCGSGKPLLITEQDMYAQTPGVARGPGDSALGFPALCASRCERQGE